MLISLAIRDVVLIDRLDLSLQPGLSVLTGETGAGKSILLDALGLALGARGDAGLVRRGANQAVVTAEFDLPADHPARALVADLEIDPGDTLILRRTVTADGRSRAAVNDQAVSVGLLRSLGAALVEIQGQFDQHSLLNANNHRDVLDDFAGLAKLRKEVAQAWRSWQQADQARAQAAEKLSQAQAQEEYLRHALGELDKLAPQPGEETELAEKRTRLQHRGKLMASLTSALSDLTGDRGAEPKLAGALRLLTRLGPEAGSSVDPVIASLDRAANDLADAVAGLEAMLADDDFEEGRLEQIEERLFALRAQARKHQVDIATLPTLRQTLAEQLASIEAGEDGLTRLDQQAAEAKAAYLRAAEAISHKRRATAEKLDRAIMAELVPLKLDKARFRTRIDTLPDGSWTHAGIDRIAFEIATNPGAEPGPLAKIASGGELSRFLLALKVVLAATSPIPSLVFDEVDSGIGGAVAAAVGQRLQRLGDKLQVLVITHSPQVAALGATHWFVVKRPGPEGGMTTTVEQLNASERREEIARMLSGAEITAEARAAADRLLNHGAAKLL